MNECSTTINNIFGVPSSLGGVIHAARKYKGLTQIEIAEALNISQSALSKMESGLLTPSAPQWFFFCSLVDINPESLVQSYIDRGIEAHVSQDYITNGFKIPKKYSQNKGSKIKSILPLLLYFHSVYGTNGIRNFLKSIKIHPDFFYDLDNQLNLNFSYDLVRHLFEKGKIKKENVGNIAFFVSNPIVHENLVKVYKKELSSINLLSIFVKNYKQYQCNFKHEILDRNDNQIDISISSNEFANAFKYTTDKNISHMLSLYQKKYLEIFVNTFGQNAVEVELLEESNQDKNIRWIYQAKLII